MNISVIGSIMTVTQSEMIARMLEKYSPERMCSYILMVRMPAMRNSKNP